MPTGSVTNRQSPDWRSALARSKSPVLEITSPYSVPRRPCRCREIHISRSQHVAGHLRYCRLSTGQSLVDSRPPSPGRASNKLLTSIVSYPVSKYHMHAANASQPLAERNAPRRPARTAATDSGLVANASLDRLVRGRPCTAGPAPSQHHNRAPPTHNFIHTQSTEELWLASVQTRTDSLCWGRLWSLHAVRAYSRLPTEQSSVGRLISSRPTCDCRLVT